MVEFVGQMPRGLTLQASAKAKLKYRAVIYLHQNIASGREILQSLKLLWSHGHFLVAAHSVRLLYEIWAALLFMEGKVLRPVEEGKDIPEADALLQRLMLGTNTECQLPAGLTQRYEVIHIGKMKKVARDVVADFNETYDFLCDVSHPTFLHDNFHLAEYDVSWSNELAKSEKHRILEKIVSISEQATLGIREAGKRTYGTALPDLTNLPNEAYPSTR